MAKQTESSFWDRLFDGISCCGERGKLYNQPPLSKTQTQAKFSYKGSSFNIIVDKGYSVLEVDGEWQPGLVSVPLSTETVPSVGSLSEGELSE